MSKYKGNIVSATQTSLSGTSYTGRANGKFTLSEQIQARGSSLWAKGLGVPDAPTIGTVTEGNALVIVSFTAPSDTGGQTITGYTATSNPSNITGTAASSPITVTGLTNGTAYTFTVAATNVSGTGASSSASNSVTPSATSVPDAPTITSVSISADAIATINFTAPYNGNSPITSYTATSSYGETGTVSQSGSGSVNVTIARTRATTFTLTATNAIGTSVPSSISSSVTAPPTVGQAYGGGFFAGQLNISNARYWIIVAPKATGNVSNTTWGPSGVTTGFTSTINGPANSAGLAALGATYPAATFCENLTIGGYSDWYLPARDELEVCYYFLKPTTDNNDIRAGSNAYAVAPEPISTNHTLTSPAQTIAGIGFRDGETNAFTISPNHYYRTSTELSSTDDMILSFIGGFVNQYGKTWNGGSVRAIRRIAV
jgi:hypothetical protein